MSVPLRTARRLMRERRRRFETTMDRFRPLDGLHVVVVDDDADGRDMVTLALTKQGAHVTGADSAAEVRNIFRYVLPDVLICDLAMPRETGLTLIQWVRRLPRDGGRTVRALALTAFTQTYGRARAFTAGFDEYATKPVDPWELCRIVAKMAGRAVDPPSDHVEQT